MRKNPGNFIGGQWCQPEQGRFLPIAGCHTDGTGARLPRSCDADIRSAVQSAHNSLFQWADLGPLQRCARLRYISEKLMLECHELARYEACSHQMDPSQVEMMLNRTLRSFCSMQAPRPVRVIRSHRDCRLPDKALVVKQISPVCGLLNQYLERQFPVIAGGHCLVIGMLYKPGARMPYALLRFLEIVGETLPGGVLNVVFGLPSEMGTYLVNCKDAMTVQHMIDSTNPDNVYH